MARRWEETRLGARKTSVNDGAGGMLGDAVAGGAASVVGVAGVVGGDPGGGKDGTTRTKTATVLPSTRMMVTPSFMDMAAEVRRARIVLAASDSATVRK